MNKTDRHIGSSFDSFLEEEGILDEVKAVAAKRVIAWQLAQEMAAQHITKQAMAETLHTSRSQIARLLDPENPSVYLTTLARAANAVGMHIEIGLVPGVGGRLVSIPVAVDAVRVSQAASDDLRSPEAAPAPRARAKRQAHHA